MKKASNNQPPPSALQTVGALGRELVRLSKQLEDTAAEIAETDEPSRRIALEKLNAQRSGNFARLSKQALLAERELKLLIEKSDADAVWSRRIEEFKSALDYIPRRLMTHPLFAGVDGVALNLILQKEFDEALAFLWEENKARREEASR
jgi:hypothetical protein